MTDALLRGRGLRTGRFTSPHLVSIRERIVVDGAPVSAERFIEAYEEILPYVRLVDEHHPVAMSFFEVLTGMAFAIFADTPVDVVVLEVGVGGRLDCTNVADGVVAVITPISIDHTSCSATRSRRSRGRRPASSSRARSRCWPSSRWPP